MGRGGHSTLPQSDLSDPPGRAGPHHFPEHVRAESLPGQPRLSCVVGELALPPHAPGPWGRCLASAVTCGSRGQRAAPRPRERGGRQAGIAAPAAEPTGRSPEGSARPFAGNARYKEKATCCAAPRSRTSRARLQAAGPPRPLAPAPLRLRPRCTPSSPSGLQPRKG